MPEKIERPAQIMHSPISNVPRSTASYSRLPELAPPVLVARPIIPVPAPAARPVVVVPAARRDLAAPIVHHAPAAAALTPRHVQPAIAHPVQPIPAPAVHLVHAPSVVRRAAPRRSHVRAVPVHRQNHAAPFCCDLSPPAGCHAASIIRPDHAAPPFAFYPGVAPFVPVTARPLPSPIAFAPSVSVHTPLPFSLRPDLAPSAPVAARPPPSPVTFVPPVYTPAPLPFPLCPSPALSASAALRIKSSPVEAQNLELAPVRRDSRTRRSNEECAPVEKSQKQEDKQSPRRCVEDEEDVAVQKEEGRRWKIDARLNNDKNERDHAIDRQQKVETQQELDSQQDGDTEQDRVSETADEQGSTANEDQTGRIADEDRTRMADEEWTRRIVDEDHTRIADKDLQDIEQHQEDVEQPHTTNDYDQKHDTLISPISPPAPELLRELSVSADTDTQLAVVPVLSPVLPSRLEIPDHVRSSRSIPNASRSPADSPASPNTISAPSYLHDISHRSLQS